MSDRGELVLEIPSAAAMDDLGRRLGRLLRGGDLLVLSGDLGAGKTTLVKGLGEGMGVRGPITSPTFVIARVHPSLVGGPALVHADAYRLQGALELDDLDLDADAGSSVVVVEWGRGLVEQLAGDRLEVDLHREDGDPSSLASPAPADAGEVDEHRTAVLRGVGQRWADVGALLGVDG
ncbi:tRNA (adenosine(37)-N6)-threonylcarbamoyltransferase complex ATPase subunit type 1 TsaE [uncultured Pseudokineococcus sp.]|uniref:tRNA (adenosine(37)-N6)-threonylcarbamoyltransferase complex ATPase subunit type 1 TsaE n=1 Tax=uncultured Pseudokineococcus sp. TaxID=1642928 RepID=UPI0026231DDF|nr:tRNA (adenosine(37)-N6)-threonylcarbamoyltransferase complex ATPase subunit type 1 TsaE [uncultured Pseudokineococcus sp.]